MLFGDQNQTRACARGADNREVEEDEILIKTNHFLMLTVATNTSSHREAVVERKAVLLSRKLFIPVC